MSRRRHVEGGPDIDDLNYPVIAVAAIAAFVVFIQEFFTGILVPLFGSGLEATQRRFGAMNAALERRLEQRPSG